LRNRERLALGVVESVHGVDAPEAGDARGQDERQEQGAEDAHPDAAGEEARAVVGSSESDVGAVGLQE